MMNKSYVYMFDQLESTIFLEPAVLWALFPIMEGNFEILYLFKPTSSETYTDTLMKGLVSPSKNPPVTKVCLGIV